MSIVNQWKRFRFYLSNEKKFINSYLDPSVGRKEFILFLLNKKKFLQKYIGTAFDFFGGGGNYMQYNPYYLKYGYKFPMYEFAYYAASSGVKSDLYLPCRFARLYIWPYLNCTQKISKYSNKAMMDSFLDIKETQKHIDVLTPQNIVLCDKYYYKNGSSYERCTYENAIQAVLSSEGDLIIKPGRSAHGDGIILLDQANKNESRVRDIFEQYGDNFVIQKKVIQHPELAKLNETSVNTIRITTYRDFNEKLKILYATLRFGAKGSICDNIDPHETNSEKRSGGFCAIKDDGTIVREVHRIRGLNTTTLSDDIVEKIPSFEKIKTAVLFLHTKFPDFALMAWDVTVTPEEHPLIIEYNFMPGLGSCQLAHGPMFCKDDLDEIMERVSKVQL